MTISYTLGIQPKWYIVGLDGLPAAGALIYTFSNLDHQVSMPTYQDDAGMFPNTNPIIADANGTVGPIYWKFDTANPTQLYYVEITDTDANPIYSFDNFTGSGSGGGGSITIASLSNNIIANNVFYRNIGTSVSPVPTYLKVAPAAHAGFALTSSNFGPDTVFIKSNTSAIDQITFPQFSLGDTSFGSDTTPSQYCNYTCTNTPSSETYKQFIFPIVSNVRNLSSATASVSIWMRSNDGNITIQLTWAQFFGDGTGASATQITDAGASFTVTSSWNPYQQTQLTIPSVGGNTEGFCQNSGLFLILNIPLNSPVDIDFCKPAVYASQYIPSVDFQTNDQISAQIDTPRTGDIEPAYHATAPLGYLLLNDGTIGSSSSAATNVLTNRDIFPLYNELWNNVSNTYCPVSGGRGSSAVADFSANKTLQLPLILGRTLAASGQGSGLSNWVLGQSFGEEKHTMLVSELVPHQHVMPMAGVGGSQAYPAISAQSPIFNSITNSTGGGTPFNVIQPTSHVNYFIKL